MQQLGYAQQSWPNGPLTAPNHMFSHPEQAKGQWGGSSSGRGGASEFGEAKREPRKKPEKEREPVELAESITIVYTSRTIANAIPGNKWFIVPRPSVNGKSIEKCFAESSLRGLTKAITANAQKKGYDYNVVPRERVNALFIPGFFWDIVADLVQWKQAPQGKHPDEEFANLVERLTNGVDQKAFNVEMKEMEGWEGAGERGEKRFEIERTLGRKCILLADRELRLRTSGTARVVAEGHRTYEGQVAALANGSKLYPEVKQRRENEASQRERQASMEEAKKKEKKRIEKEERRMDSHSSSSSSSSSSTLSHSPSALPSPSSTPVMEMREGRGGEGEQKRETEPRKREIDREYEKIKMHIPKALAAKVRQSGMEHALATGDLKVLHDRGGKKLVKILSVLKKDKNLKPETKRILEPFFAEFVHEDELDETKEKEKEKKARKKEKKPKNPSVNPLNEDEKKKEEEGGAEEEEDGKERSDGDDSDDDITRLFEEEEKDLKEKQLSPEPSGKPRSQSSSDAVRNSQVPMSLVARVSMESAVEVQEEGEDEDFLNAWVAGAKKIDLRPFPDGDFMIDADGHEVVEDRDGVSENVFLVSKVNGEIMGAEKKTKGVKKKGNCLIQVKEWMTDGTTWKHLDVSEWKEGMMTCGGCRIISIERMAVPAGSRVKRLLYDEEETIVTLDHPTPDGFEEMILGRDMWKFNVKVDGKKRKIQITHEEELEIESVPRKESHLDCIIEAKEWIKRTDDIGWELLDVEDWKEGMVTQTGCKIKQITPGIVPKGTEVWRAGWKENQRAIVTKSHPVWGKWMRMNLGEERICYGISTEGPGGLVKVGGEEAYICLDNQGCEMYGISDRGTMAELWNQALELGVSFVGEKRSCFVSENWKVICGKRLAQFLKEGKERIKYIESEDMREKAKGTIVIPSANGRGTGKFLKSSPIEKEEREEIEVKMPINMREGTFEVMKGRKKEEQKRLLEILSEAPPSMGIDFAARGLPGESTPRLLKGKRILVNFLLVLMIYALIPELAEGKSVRARKHHVMTDWEAPPFTLANGTRVIFQNVASPPYTAAPEDALVDMTSYMTSNEFGDCITQTIPFEANMVDINIFQLMIHILEGCNPCSGGSIGYGMLAGKFRNPYTGVWKGVAMSSVGGYSVNYAFMCINGLDAGYGRYVGMKKVPEVAPAENISAAYKWGDDQIRNVVNAVVECRFGENNMFSVYAVSVEARDITVFYPVVTDDTISATCRLRRGTRFDQTFELKVKTLGAVCRRIRFLPHMLQVMDPFCYQHLTAGQAVMFWLFWIASILSIVGCPIVCLFYLRVVHKLIKVTKSGMKLFGRCTRAIFLVGDEPSKFFKRGILACFLFVSIMVSISMMYIYVIVIMSLVGGTSAMPVQILGNTDSVVSGVRIKANVQKIYTLTYVGASAQCVTKTSKGLVPSDCAEEFVTVGFACECCEPVALMDVFTCYWVAEGNIECQGCQMQMPTIVALVGDSVTVGEVLVTNVSTGFTTVIPSAEIQALGVPAYLNYKTVYVGVPPFKKPCNLITGFFFQGGDGRCEMSDDPQALTVRRWTRAFSIYPPDLLVSIKNVSYCLPCPNQTNATYQSLNQTFEGTLSECESNKGYESMKEHLPNERVTCGGGVCQLKADSFLSSTIVGKLNEAMFIQNGPSAEICGSTVDGTYYDCYVPSQWDVPGQMILGDLPFSIELDQDDVCNGSWPNDVLTLVGSTAFQGYYQVKENYSEPFLIWDKKLDVYIACVKPSMGNLVVNDSQIANGMYVIKPDKSRVSVTVTVETHTSVKDYTSGVVEDVGDAKAYCLARLDVDCTDITILAAIKNIGDQYGWDPSVIKVFLSQSSGANQFMYSKGEIDFDTGTLFGGIPNLIIMRSALAVGVEPKGPIRVTWWSGFVSLPFFIMHLRPWWWAVGFGMIAMVTTLGLTALTILTVAKIVRRLKRLGASMKNGAPSKQKLLDTVRVF